MQSSDDQAQRIRELEAQLEAMRANAREMVIIARCARERINQAIRDSDRRAERYLPVLRRAGLLPEQRSRRRLF